MVPELLAEGWVDAVGEALQAIDATDAADGVVQLSVSGGPAGTVNVFHAVVAAGRVSLAAGRHSQPDAVLSWSHEDFSDAWRGDLSLESAYMSGRMKLEGDQVLVKVINVDPSGKVRLSRRALLPAPADAPADGRGDDMASVGAPSGPRGRSRHRPPRHRGNREPAKRQD